MGYLTLTQFKDILKNMFLVLATETVGCMRLKSGGCDSNVWWFYLGTPDFKTPMLHMGSLFRLKTLLNKIPLSNILWMAKILDIR